MKLKPVSHLRDFWSGHPKSVAYAAFAATVLAGVVAAVMVAGNDVPLVLGGL